MEYCGLPKLPALDAEELASVAELAQARPLSGLAAILGFRVARYYKLVEINAPPNIIENEGKLIAMAVEAMKARDDFRGRH